MGEGPDNSLPPSLGCACNPGWGLCIQKGSTSPLESWIPCHSPICLIDPWAIGPPPWWPCSQPTSSPRTSTRTWTSGRGGPPAQDTSTPPPTAARACPPPSPAHLTTTTALVRKGGAPKGTGRARGQHSGLMPPAAETEQGFPEISSQNGLHRPVVTLVTSWASLSPCRCPWQGRGRQAVGKRVVSC